MLLFVFLVLLYAELISSQQCVSSCFTLSYYGCQFCFDGCTLQSCRLKYCASYYYYQGNMRCTSYGYGNPIDQTTCIASCCGDGQKGQTQMTLELANQCVANDKKMGTTVGAIVGGVVGGIFLIIICAVIFIWWKRNR